MDENEEDETAATILLEMRSAPIRFPRSASRRVPRTNLGRRHFLNKNFNFRSYANVLLLTEEQGEPLFSSLDIDTPKMVTFTDLYDNAEMEMNLLYLAATNRNYIIGQGWEVFVGKHASLHTLGVIRFYKEFDIWGGHKMYLLKFVRLKSVPRIEAKNDDIPPAKRRRTDSGKAQRNIIS